LISALKKNKDEFNRFLNVSKNVFAENVMLRVGLSTWVINAQDVDLKMEGQATFIFKNLDLICYGTGDTLEILKTNSCWFLLSWATSSTLSFTQPIIFHENRQGLSNSFP
jgi:hypothetical protein